MRFRIYLHVDVDPRDEAQARDWARKLGELLQNPLVRMSIEGEGIRVAGVPQAHEPQRLE